MAKDREYIKELFDSDDISAPESLSEENMLRMLENADQPEPEAKSQEHFEARRAKKRLPVKRIAAIAAAALIAVLGIGSVAGIMTAPPDTSVKDGELYTFQSKREIKNLLSGMDVYNYSNSHTEYATGSDELLEYEATTDETAANDTGYSGDQTSKAASSEDSASHSETYLQVDEVDEADIVKTDGKYIYYVNSDREVVILSAENGKTKRVSVIGNTGIENYIDDIYLKGDKLITVGTYYKDDTDEELSGIVVYDISDRSDPEVIADFSQSGTILTSRMVGDHVYLVTNEYVYKGGKTVPVCGSYDAAREMDAADICCVPDPDMPSYVILSGIDISSGAELSTTTKAILGASSDIYCNDHNLYVTSAQWDEGSGAYYTRLVRADLDGSNVKFNAAAKVRGYVISQFAMDESNGYFRIATTSERGGIDVNNLFILDKDLKEAGKVTGFARNENIKAVRYIGDKAYVITYEEIDPLFIIDLSDPNDPRIEGEVMIDGFSTLLVPAGEGRLLGIGHATGDNGYGGEYDSGLKLALFDISDPSEPKVIDSKEFEDMSSFAQDDHHALMVNSDKGYYAIPYDIYHYTEEPVDEDEAYVADDEEMLIEDPYEPYYESGILIFKADDIINSVDQHTLGESTIYRSVYIGDWIYALDGDGNVNSFKPGF